MKEYKFKVSGKDYTVSVGSVEENIVNVVVNDTSYEVELENAPENFISAPPPTVAAPTVQRPAEVADSLSSATATSGESRPLKSPLPGVILDFFVKIGDTVKNGQKVLVLEAMKMENNIDADRDGTVLEIKAAKGDSVNEGDVLLIIG
jgi:biotin carboxyl carrier protein